MINSFSEKLTPKQHLFIQEYIKDFNASRAAIAAGYSQKTASEMGYENLNKPHLQRAIAEVIQVRGERISREGDDVVRKLWEAMEADPIDYLVVESDGSIRAMPLEEIPVETRRLITKMRVKRRRVGENTEIEEFEITLMSKDRALELLAKHHGLLLDRVEHTGKDHGPIKVQDLTDEELLEIISRARGG